MKASHLFTTIIAVSGRTGSGKTTLARELCQRLRASYTSFGAFVRAEASNRNIEVNRPNLQILGQSLIDELGSEEFVKRVLNFAERNNEFILIVDGVRNVEIWQTLQKIQPRSALLFIDVDENLRLSRALGRGDIDRKMLERLKTHPIEANIDQLREYADIILHDSSLDAKAYEFLKKNFDL
jgi:adenylate kinase family enzyme